MNRTRAYGEFDSSGDVELAALAARQYGVVATRQVLELGFSRHQISRRVNKALLHRFRRGVYAVGHTRLTFRGRWMGFLLACGDLAVLSHHAAAALHDLRTVPTGLVDVTVPSPRHVSGVRCHAVRTLDPRDVTVIDGIPVTTVDRVLLDQADVVSRQRLRTLLEAAQRRDLLDAKRLRRLIARSPGRRGIPPLTAVLDELHDEAPWTQSELERRFLELIRAGGLTEPEVNVVVDGELVDFHWPGHHLVVEVDGYRFHKTRDAFEADRRRDTKLKIAGLDVIRVTHRRIADDVPALVRELRALLSRGREPPGAASGR
jgi:very-short-patch-repair endonuclease/predicted transcriptional regulator of viral defense system